MKRLETTVSGRVQMVMFRDFTRRNAETLGIVGVVKNMPDGTVFVVAEGEENALRKFLSRLKKGSFLSRVDTVREVWSEATHTYTDFKIDYYG